MGYISFISNRGIFHVIPTSCFEYNGCALVKKKQSKCGQFWQEDEICLVRFCKIWREEVRAVSRTTGKKDFAAGRTIGKKALAALQARRLLPHHRQEGFCRTTHKKAFAAPQARGLLPHLRRDGFVAAQWANNILAAPDKSIFPSHR